MSQFIILGAAPSSYVRTTRMVCFEKGLDHKLEPIELGSPAHLALHPWGRMPMFQHGDVRLIETSAIARYLDEVGSGPSLVPSTAAARATMEQWISILNCYLYDSLVRSYALEYVLPMFRNEEPDRARIAAGVPAMQRDVARLDAAYSGREWIAGDALSLADLFVAPVAQTVGMFPEGKAALAAAPNLARAYAALERRPSFVRAHAGLFGRPQ